jgi:hypothetical protein
MNDIKQIPGQGFAHLSLVGDKEWKSGTSRNSKVDGAADCPEL